MFLLLQIFHIKKIFLINKKKKKCLFIELMITKNHCKNQAYSRKYLNCKQKCFSINKS